MPPAVLSASTAPTSRPIRTGPAVSRKAAVSGLLGKLVQHVFDGSARRLVAHLIEEGALDEREREEILEILKSRQDKDKKPSPKKKGTNA